MAHLVISADAVIAAAVAEGTDPTTLANMFTEAVSHSSRDERYTHADLSVCEDGG